MDWQDGLHDFLEPYKSRKSLSIAFNEMKWSWIMVQTIVIILSKHKVVN